MPVDAHKAYVRLRYQQGGVWNKLDYEFYLAGDNHPPVISGVPGLTAAVGEAYEFQATATDADGEKLTFSITKKPSWASFINRAGTLSGSPVQAGTFSDIKISVTDERGATASLPAFTIDVEQPAATSSQTISVTSSSDDAEENVATGALSRSSTDLELVRDGSATQLVGIRFQGINIPQGATITDARIQFTTDETSSGAVTLDIKGENTDNAATFAGQYGISSRAVTAASANWVPPDWTTLGEVGGAQRTSDLSAVVQEIVNRPGWQIGNALSFIISSTDPANKRVAGSFDGGAAPTLSIDYSFVNQPPVIDPIPAASDLLDTASVGTSVMTVTASDPEGDTVSWSINGAVPFTIDTQGKVTVNAALQAGTYQFEVQVSDGALTASAPVTIVVTEAVSVEQVLQSGVASGIDAATLLDATIAELAQRKSPKPLLSQLYGSDPIAYTPGNRTQLLDIKPWVDKAFPILTGNKGNTLALAGTTPTARYAAFGMSPTELFQNGASLGFVTPFNRLLAWLLAGEPVNVSELDGSRKIALSFASSDRTNIRDWIASAHPNWTVTDCGDVATLVSCYSSADLVITGWQGNNADAQTIRQALSTVMDAGKPVLYVHTWYEAYNDVAHAIADLLNFSLRYGGNYWANDAAIWVDVTAQQEAIWNQRGFGGIDKMLGHFKAEDYAFDWSACVDEDCSAVTGLDSEFQQGASKVRDWMTQLDNNKVDLFQSGESHLLRLLALLGDSYRQGVRFPMDKVQTADNTFLKAYFADHAVYSYRGINPVQPDMGNFSRSDFSHITPVSKTVDLDSKVNFRSAGVYALPGQTVRVTRLDSSNLAVRIFVNTQRSGSTHQWAVNGYSRPKYLQSPQMEVKSGETITFTSPYGGPVQVAFSANDLPVQLRFENVGEHPYWRSSADNASFTEKLATGAYDWAELVTPGFEVHSSLDKMRISVANWGDAATLAAKTMRHLHNFPHVLAGFQGPGIDVIAEIHDFASQHNMTIEALDMVKHMNADQASCGYGCSGNPYDAYWAFDAIGHGDIHELGHGLERDRFRFSGWEGHSVTNPYSYYSKTQYYKDTGIDPSCQELPFAQAFTALQESIGQTDPAAYLDTNYWSTSGWSQQFMLTLQMMMSAQNQGALLDGWHLLARLHILEREFNRATATEVTWTAKKDSLGFSSYTRDEALAITNNDWMLIAVSFTTGLDYRDYLSMWGQSFSAKADAQVAGFAYAPVSRRFFISSSDGYCRGEGFDGTNLPVDGEQVWPN